MRSRKHAHAHNYIHFREENTSSSTRGTKCRHPSLPRPPPRLLPRLLLRLPPLLSCRAATSTSPISASVALQTIAAPSPSPRRASAPHAASLLQGTTTPSSKRRRTDPAPKAGIGYNVGFIGCGNMARALVEGMLASGKQLGT